MTAVSGGIASDDLALILLDLDGTLVDSRALIIHNMHVAFDGCGLAPPSDDHICSVIGLSLEHLIVELAPDVEPKVHADLVLRYRTEALRKRAEGEDAETLFPGIKGAIDSLRGEGYLLGIATGKARRGVLHFCERFEMNGWFDTIQTPDNNPSKPHPGMIESAMAETGARLDRTIMVGDTSFDMEMARNAGVTGLGVTWGNHAVSVLERAGAEHIVEQGQDLPDIIEQVLEEGTKT